jgi:hypothetical protein
VLRVWLRLERNVDVAPLNLDCYVLLIGPRRIAEIDMFDQRHDLLAIALCYFINGVVIAAVLSSCSL